MTAAEQPMIDIEFRIGPAWKIVRYTAWKLSKWGLTVPAPVLAWLASRFVLVRVKGSEKWMKLRTSTKPLRRTCEPAR